MQVNYHAIFSYMHQYSGLEYEEIERIDNRLSVDIANQEANNHFLAFIKMVETRYNLYAYQPPKWSSKNKCYENVWVNLRKDINSFKPTNILIFIRKDVNEQEIYFQVGLDFYSRLDVINRENRSKHFNVLECDFTSKNNYHYYFKENGSYQQARKIDEVEVQRIRQTDDVEKLQLCYELTYSQVKNEQLTNEQIQARLLEAADYLKTLYDSAEGLTIEPKKFNVTWGNNMILYGPPGTGKTYHTALYAVAIIENKSLLQLKEERYEDVLQRYNVYKQSGQIQFTTFHQSYSYEDFIEGIKPKLETKGKELQYEVAPGLFKQFCEKAQTLHMDTGTEQFKDVRVWKISLGGSGERSVKTLCFERKQIRVGWPNVDIAHEQEEGYTNDSLYYFFEEMKIGDIVLSLRDQKHIDAIGIIESAAYIDNQTHPHYIHTRAVKWIATNINERIYEMNGNVNLTQQTVYPLKRITKAATNELIQRYMKIKAPIIEENSNNYVFIIDEINRGNIAKILGELITLIESSKRLGASEEMTVTLPYSKESFGVPKNVYILGTMNTADRSIALLDTALRRRFQFMEIMPDASVLRDVYVEGIYIEHMLAAMNERITVLYDREHTIGHAFFMPLKETPTIDCLANIFERAIIPLLQEYFYEDYYRIQLVLGDNAKPSPYQFITHKSVPNVFKGVSDGSFNNELYEIQKEALYEKESYIGIYE